MTLLLLSLVATARGATPALPDIEHGRNWEIAGVAADPDVGPAAADHGQSLGGALVMTADADGDGLPELWMAAPRADRTGEHVDEDHGYVVAATAVDLVPGEVIVDASLWTVWGVSAGGSTGELGGAFGGTLARWGLGVGPSTVCASPPCIDDDMNGDGFSDLLVGQVGYPSKVWVLPGGLGMFAVASVEITDLDRYVLTLADDARLSQDMRACDFDGDPDTPPGLAISDSKQSVDPCGGEDVAEDERGAVLAVSDGVPLEQSQDLCSLPLVARVIGDSAEDNLGYRLGCADLDGQPGDELIVSVSASGSTLRGVVLIDLSENVTATRTASEAPLLLLGEGGRGEAPLFIAPRADLDGDGREDLVLGLPTASCGACAGQECGAVAVFLEPSLDASALDVEDASLLICGDSDGQWFGAGLTAGADLNGGGVDDLVVAEDADEGASRNRVYVFYGESLFSEDLARADEGAEVDAVDAATHVLELADALKGRFGRNMTLGDLNVDGFADLAIGAPRLRPAEHLRSRSGGVWVLYGGPDRDGDGWFARPCARGADGEPDCSGYSGDYDDADPSVGQRLGERPTHAEEPDYLDRDGDGFSPVEGDCDDDDPSVHPGGDEGDDADGVNQDCDLRTDELTVGHDDDRDGYADGDEGDCDDADPAVHPGQAEICDGVDNDCDGLTDQGEALQGGTRLFRDADGDGVGDEAGWWCVAPSGWVAEGGDCDDADPSVHPGAAEVWYDGVDQSCLGVDGDADRDGYTVEGYSGSFPGELGAGDCDDGDAEVYPGSTLHPYDLRDTDCDGAENSARMIWPWGCASAPGVGGAAAWLALLLALRRRYSAPGSTSSPSVPELRKSVLGSSSS